MEFWNHVTQPKSDLNRWFQPRQGKIKFWKAVLIFLLSSKVLAQGRDLERFTLNDFRPEDWVETTEEREWSLQQRQRLRSKSVSALWNEEKLAVRPDVLLSKEKKKKPSSDSPEDE